MDYDEILVPKKHNNWSEMMEEIRMNRDNDKVMGWSFKVFYFISSPKRPNALTNVSKIMSKIERFPQQKYVKSISNLKNIKTVNNHRPNDCLKVKGTR